VKKPGPSRAGLASTFFLGCLLFNFPLVRLFNVPGTILGIPVLYAYLFAAWALLIVLVAVLFERSE
jgi:hypothetical protein